MQQEIFNTFDGGMKSSIVDEAQESNVYRIGRNVYLHDVSSNKLRSPELVDNPDALFDDAEQGAEMALTNFPGAVVAFSVTEGFTPIASKEYKGIIYIMSISDDEETVEFGSYPSYQNGVFLETYSPFTNFVDYDYHNILPLDDDAGDPSFPSNTLPLRISNQYVGTALNKKQEMEIKERFDKTVDLYIVNLNGKDIVINSGFVHSDGTPVLNIYNELSFKSGTHYIINDASLPKLVVTDVSAGGRFTSGVYHIFVRYLTKDTPTTFLSYVAVPVFIAGENNNVVSGGKDNQEAGAKITLNISDIDLGQEYFQIGFIYYFGTQSKYAILNKRFRIEASSQSIVLNGTEDTTTIEEDYFYVTKNPIKQHKTLDVLDDKLVVGNGVSSKVHNEEIYAYAKSVEIKETRRLLSSDNKPYYNLDSYQNSYNDFSDYQHVGYHSGETYMFKLHAVFFDGTIADGYGMKGYDNSQGNYANENYNGIYRFSEANVIPFYENNEIYAKLPTFDFPEIDSQWIKDNVSHWVISRAKRNKNKLYMGVAMNLCNGSEQGKVDNVIDAYNSYLGLLEDGSFMDGDIKWNNKNKYFPLVNKNMYAMYQDNEGGVNSRDTAAAFGGFKDTYVEHDRLLNAMAVQSPDIIIDSYKGLLEVGQYVSHIAITERDESTRNNNESMCYIGNVINKQSPSVFHLQNYNYSSLQTFHSKQKEIKQADVNGDGKYISKIEDGGPNRGFFYYEDSGDKQQIFSLGMIAPSYIVNEFEENRVGSVFNPNHQNYIFSNETSIVTTYSKNPNTIQYKETYDPNNTSLFLITNKIDLALLGNKSIVCGGGDCFTQRVYWRAITGRTDLSQQNLDKIEYTDAYIAPGVLENSVFKDDSFHAGVGYGYKRNLSVGYGYMVSAVLECNHNFWGKYEEGSNYYFPFTHSIRKPHIYANITDVVESPYYNYAFDHVLHQRSFFCYNFFSNKDSYFPFRVQYSNQQNYFSRQDAWRNFPAGQQKDFDQIYGEITKVVVDNKRLFIVQHYAVQYIPTNERLMVADGVSPIIFGNIKFMSDISVPILKVGSRHQFSVIKGANGFYGMSDIDNKIWYVQGNAGDLISMTKGLEQDINKRFQQSKWGTNGENDNADIPDEGLIESLFSAYDKQHKHVLFVFDCKNYKRVIAFSEKRGAFFSEFDYQPQFYMNLNNRLFGVDKNGYKEQVWEFDVDKLNYQSVFGTTLKAGVSVSIKKFGGYEKQFHSHELMITPSNLLSLAWQTHHQRYYNEVSQIPYWFKPQYRNGHWYIPIPRAQTIQRNQNEYSDKVDNIEAESVMVGQYLHFTFLIESNQYWRALGVKTIFTVTKN